MRARMPQLVRPIVVPMLGLALILSACGSSDTSASGSRSSSATPSSTKTTSPTAPTAQPTVGPTNPSAAPSPQPAALDLHIVKRGGEAIVLAPVVIHGKTYDFVVDTGATATVVDATEAKALGLKRTKDAPIPVVGIGGSEKAYLATISDWSLGRAKLPTSTITVSNIGLSGGLVGLLGSDVLSTFGKVTINYDTQKATLG